MRLDDRHFKHYTCSTGGRYDLEIRGLLLLNPHYGTAAQRNSPTEQVNIVETITCSQMAIRQKMYIYNIYIYIYTSENVIVAGIYLADSCNEYEENNC